MKANARNQFAGTISQVLIGAVNAEVDIKLKGISSSTTASKPWA